MEGMKTLGMDETTGTQGGRRPTGVPVVGLGSRVLTSEVEVRRTRRRHTLVYKLRVLETVEHLRVEGGGAIGAYLRKEGLYYSTVRKWARNHEEGKLSSTRCGPKEKSREALHSEIHQLRRKIESTERKLKKTELIVELQKKLSLVLGLEISNEGREES